ncbi:MAG TPA: ABC transporter permease [Vicinamibacterales bacterium]|nr:ABC transporter permease [Vicinamibacterales bacterium]
MIWTIVRVGLLRMWHGRVELALAFVVPVAFFTVFALIFSGQDGLGRSPRVDVALVDEDQTELSREILAGLAGQPVLRVYVGDGASLEPVGEVERLVTRGAVPVAVVIPAGWSTALDADDEHGPVIRILSDSSDPVATQVVAALVRQTAGQVLGERARQQVQQILVAGALASGGLPNLSAAEAKALAAVRVPRSLDVEVRELLAAGKANPAVSMYAAGIAVMFLLFSAVGSAGSLLEEEENQTLERLLNSRLGLTRLLVGKWLLVVLIGLAQLIVMFAWAQAAFGVNLLAHLSGFVVMAVATAAAAASLALVLATLCRSRAQLNAVAIIVILTMSALGGSMVPRYAMSETMQDVGRITFNAWALDGFMKVFWRGLGPADLFPEVAVLGGTAAALFVLARRLARRWASS